MSSYEKIQTLLNETKNHPNTDANEFFNDVYKNFSSLNHEQREIISSDFYTWVVQNSPLNLNLAYANCLLASNAFFSENYEKVFLYGNIAQHLFNEQNHIGAALCSIVIGSSFRTLGNMDIGLKYLWEAEEVLDKSGTFPFGHMACTYNIGGIYYDMKHYDEALPVFEKTLKKAEAVNDKIWIANATNGIGKTYLGQKRFPQALRFLEKSLVLSEELPPYFKGIALTDLANYYSETNEYDKAEKMHFEALEIREKINRLGGAITNIIALGELFFKDEKISEAIAILEKGLKMAEEIKVKPKLFQIHRLLSKIYESKNKTDKSLYHFKQYHSIREEVEKEDAEKKVKNLQLVFEAEQTKKENIIIKKQKAEIEQKNIELQQTIDELTRTKVGKKAKVFTLIIAIVLFIIEEFIIHNVLHLIATNDFIISFIVKMVIIFSLKPIDSAIEHYLLKKIIKKGKPKVVPAIGRY